MYDGVLIRSLTLLVGPPDALGAVPALKCCLKWAEIWLQKEPKNILAIQIIYEILNSLKALEQSTHLPYKYFPAKKQNGQNVFKGHSLSTSPLWSLTPIQISSETDKGHFDTLAAAYLSWVLKSADRYIDLYQYSEWMEDSHQSNNPAKPILSAAHGAALAIRKLVDKSSYQLIEDLAITAWSTDRQTFISILLSLDLEQDEHNRVKRLRSLFNLANGYRPLYRRRFSSRQKEKTSNIRSYSNGISSTYHSVEIQNIGRGTIHTPITPSEDINGEDTDSISLVGVDFKSIFTNETKEKILDAEKNIKSLYSIAAYKAKHIARANHFDNLNAMRIHPSELKAIDEFILNDAININDRMIVLLILVSGRSIENLQKKPTLIIFNENGEPTLQLTINKPKIKEHNNCIKTEDTIFSPYPNRWLPAISEFISKFGDSISFPLARTSTDISKIIKKHNKNYKISTTKLHRLLALSILDTTQDDGIASLLCDPLTTISATKNHYIMISKKNAVIYLNKAWTHILSELEDKEGIQSPPDQKGHIGSANVPESKLLRGWVNLKPAAGTWENEFFNYRKNIVLEGLALAHRGVTDPNPIFISDPNPDLKAGFVIINDKDRGGKGQMSRLAVVPTNIIKKIRDHNERTASYTQGSQAMLYPSNARTPSLGSGSVIRPKDLVKTEPCLPCPANGPRKLFRSKMAEKIPGELVDAIMGWQTHGLVPYSEFSSLAPYMTMACCEKSIAEFYEKITNEEDHEENI